MKKFRIWLATLIMPTTPIKTQIFERGYFKKGRLLNTSQTRRWSPEQKEQANRQEGLLILTNFHPLDQGRGRQLVCNLNPAHPDFDENRALILAAPKMYNVISNIFDTGEVDMIELRKLLTKFELKQMEE